MLTNLQRTQMTIRILVTVATVLCCISTWAQEVYPFFKGARMMAMGGAGIATVNDETALLENPAGLGKLRDFYGTIIDPELEGDQAMESFNQGSLNDDPTNLAKVKPKLDSHQGTWYDAKEAIFPSLVTRNFGIGIYYRKFLSAEEDPTTQKVNATYYDDMAVLLGYSVRFLDGRVKIGVTGKFIDRIDFTNVSLANNADMSIAGNASEGAAIGADGGILITAPWAWLPTASAVIRDIGNTPFTAGSGLRMKTATRPATMDQDIDLAVALFPIHANTTRSTFTLEYDKIKAASKDTDKFRYYHVGYELNLSDIFFVRAGMNQKYWTAGLEFATERTQWMITSYGEDVGQTGASVEDRRYMFKFAFRF